VVARINIRRPTRASVGNGLGVRGMRISETPWMTVPKHARARAGSPDQALIKR